MDALFQIGPLLDTPLAWLTVAAFVAGMVRGFSGFGSAMIVVPVASAFYGPAAALVILLVTDTTMTLPLFVRAVRRCRWRHVVPMLVGAGVTTPLGVYLLTVLDPVTVRWIMSLTILTLVAVLAAGWRYKRAATPAAAGGVGLASGFSSGLTGLGGPPIVLFWLGGQCSEPAQVRADVIAYFTLVSVVSVYSYLLNDIFTVRALQAAVLLLLPFGLGLWAGARCFRGSSEHAYRWLAYGLCAGVAMLALPLWS